VSDSIDSLRRKIGSAGDLQSVVRTMKALAASNIGQYENSVRALIDYYRTVQLGLHASLRQGESRANWAAPEAPPRAPRTRAVVFGSDQGLVGQFNESIAQLAIETLSANPGPCRVWAVGEHVHARLTDAGLSPLGLFAVPNSVQAITALVGRIQIETESGEDEYRNAPLWVFHNRPVSGSLYEPVRLRLLPLDSQWRRPFVEIRWPTDNLAEVMGRGSTSLHALLREYLFISLYRACAESLASENASRLAAMQRAERNIDELLEQLNRGFHQLRQSGIDEELFDVISGFEALQGAL